MLRYIIILFLLASCATSEQKVTTKEIIPTQGIAGGSSEQPVEDHKLNIALLIPLSKENISSSIVKAAQLAISDSNNPDVNLILMDSDLITSNPQQLSAELTAQNIKAIVGPLYSKETEQLLPIISNKNITALSLSNDSSISNDSLLMLGVSPEAQANILTNYAISKNINHFYLLLPSNKYGKLVEKSVDEVIDGKYEITRNTSWYEQDYPDLAIEKLVQEAAANNDHDTKAIFMPQGGANLAKLNKSLEDSKLKIQLIGSQAWDHATILKYNSFNGAMLIRKNITNNQFTNEFAHLFRAKPNTIDLIGYNAVKMLANMHKDNLAVNKQTIIENNQNSGKYADIAFKANGSSMYNLQILEIHAGQFKEVTKE